MIKKLIALSLMTTALLANEARDIAVKVSDRDDGHSLHQKMTMILIDRSGKSRTRVLETFGKDYGKDEKRVMFFKSPSDVKNTAFLTYDYDSDTRDDDQWLYLPALKRVKRIPASDKSASFMGSDFSYFDMTNRDVNDYTYKILKHLKLRGEDAVMIEATPVNQSVIDESGYTKTVSIIREDINMVVRSIGFLKNGGKKYMDVRSLHEQDGVWVIDEMWMTTKRGKSTVHKTILKFDDIEVNSDIKDSLFTTRRIKRGL